MSYATGFATGSQAVTTTPVQLTASLPAGFSIVEVIVSSDTAFSFSGERGGVFIDAEQPSATARYTKRFAIANAFSYIWIKGSGSQTILWEALTLPTTST